MTINQPSLAVAPEELDRVEELVRYLAGHDGRMPTDDMPLSWWLVDALDHDDGHPLRQALASIPVRPPVRNLTPKKAHAWQLWLARYDQLAWAARRGQELDGILVRDKVLRDWVNDTLSRHLTGKLGAVETLLLKRNPLFDFNRELDTKSSRDQAAFKLNIEAVRKFYLEHKHTDIPEGYAVAGLDVHQWWHVQRARYASDTGMKEHLRQQLTRLSRLGVDLRTDKERAQEDIVFRNRDRLKEVAEYVGEYGMSALPEHGAPFVTNARKWITQYYDGKLDPAIQEVLEAIDGWSWEEGSGLGAFREFALTYGHLDVDRDHVTPDGEPIGDELYRIRKECWTAVDPKMPIKHMDDQLDSLAQQGWERGVTELGAWYDSRGKLPERDCVTASGFHLGAFMKWVYRSVEHGLLSRARLKDLSRVTKNPWWLETDKEAYATTEGLLARFARAHDHCSPFWGESWGEKGVKRDLALFVRRVCADRDAGDFSPMEPHRLEGLPGWAWSRRERAQKRRRATRAKSAQGRAAAPREPVRSVRTDVADPDSKLNRSGLRQFLPAD